MKIDLLILTMVLTSGSMLACAGAQTKVPVHAASSVSPVGHRTFEGFLEPYEAVQLAASETGIIESVSVREGDTLKQTDMIAELDNAVLRATLKMAIAKAESTGQLDAATAANDEKSAWLAQIQRLHENGHASGEELAKANAEAKIAAANLTTARELQLASRLEAERIQVQIERRMIRAPFDGIVVRLFRQKGESVSGNELLVAEIVQLEKLKTTFYVPTEIASKLENGQTLEILVGPNWSQIPARVEFVSPVTDSDSNTVRIVVVLENPELKIRSGLRCALSTELF